MNYIALNSYEYNYSNNNRMYSSVAYLLSLVQGGPGSIPGLAKLAVY